MPVLALWALVYLALRPLLRNLSAQKEVTQALLIVLLFTLVSFLSYRPALFMLTSGGALLVAQNLLGGDVKAKIATFWISAIIFPPLQAELPSVGGIAHILALDHFRVAALLLLVPAAFSIAARRTEPGRRWLALDILIVIYPIYHSVTVFHNLPFTTTLRTTIEMILDLVLPYYVLTRGFRDKEEVMYVLRNLLIACLFAASISFLEAAARKNIYSELQWVYEYTWSMTHTLYRGSLNRVQGMTSQPIVYAAQILFTLGLWFSVRGTAVRKSATTTVVILLIGALVFTWSRGPLLGAVIFGISLVMLSRLRPSVYAVTLIATIILGIVAKSAGADVAVLATLKSVFGGTEDDAASIEYRSRLLDSAIALIQQSPWFGVPNYGSYLQDLKQGEGIIDIVNTYLGVALANGMVGLALFLSPYVLVLGAILRDLGKAASRVDAQRMRFMRSSAAVIVGLLVTIFTTSIFERLPFMLLFSLAVPAAWLRMKVVQTQDAVEAVTVLQPSRLRHDISYQPLTSDSAPQY